MIEGQEYDSDSGDWANLLIAVLADAAHCAIAGGRGIIADIAALDAEARAASAESNARRADVLTHTAPRLSLDADLKTRRKIKLWRQDLVWLWAPAQEGFAFSASEIADAFNLEITDLQGHILDEIGVTRDDVITILRFPDRAVAIMRSRVAPAAVATPMRRARRSTPVPLLRAAGIVA